MLRSVALDMINMKFAFWRLRKEIAVFPFLAALWLRYALTILLVD